MCLVILVMGLMDHICISFFFLHQTQVQVGIVIYLHIEGALYAQKSVPSWFLAVFDSRIVC